MHYGKLPKTKIYKPIKGTHIRGIPPREEIEHVPVPCKASSGLQLKIPTFDVSSYPEAPDIILCDSIGCLESKQTALKPKTLSDVASSHELIGIPV